MSPASRSAEPADPSPQQGEHDDWRRLRHTLVDVLDDDLIDHPGDPAPRAAVAAVFRDHHEGAGPELLFIQRATKATDPWSGHMAFPGGRAEPGDPTPRHTAMRETDEEVGLDLGGADFVGTLDEIDGGRATGRRVLVSAHAFWLDGARPELSPNHEVADTLWVPLRDLADPGRYIDYHYPRAGSVFPGIRLDREGQVIWGLTLRFLSDLFRRLERPFIID